MSQAEGLAAPDAPAPGKRRVLVRRVARAPPKPVGQPRPASAAKEPAAGGKRRVLVRRRVRSAKEGGGEAAARKEPGPPQEKQEAWGEGAPPPPPAAGAVPGPASLLVTRDDFVETRRLLEERERRGAADVQGAVDAIPSRFPAKLRLDLGDDAHGEDRAREAAERVAAAEEARRREREREREELRRMPPGERLQATKDRRAMQNWERAQRDWQAVARSLARRVGKKDGEERDLMMNRAAEYRARVEERDLMRKAIPKTERVSNDWAGSLREGAGNTGGYVRIGNMFSGLYCPVPEESDTPMETVRSFGAAVSQPTTRDSYTRRRKQLLGRHIRDLRAHDPTDIASVEVVGTSLFAADPPPPVELPDEAAAAGAAAAAFSPSAADAWSMEENPAAPGSPLGDVPLLEPCSPGLAASDVVSFAGASVLSDGAAAPADGPLAAVSADRLELRCEAGGSRTAAVRVCNEGTTTLYYRWVACEQAVPTARRFWWSAPAAGAVLQPGEERDFGFTFCAPEEGGTFVRRVRLETVPALPDDAAVVVTLRGEAARADTREAAREDVRKRVASGAARRKAIEALRRVEAAARRPAPPPSSEWRRLFYVANREARLYHYDDVFEALQGVAAAALRLQRKAVLDEHAAALDDEAGPELAARHLAAWWGFDVARLGALLREVPTRRQERVPPLLAELDALVARAAVRPEPDEARVGALGAVLGGALRSVRRLGDHHRQLARAAADAARAEADAKAAAEAEAAEAEAEAAKGGDEDEEDEEDEDGGAEELSDEAAAAAAAEAEAAHVAAHRAVAREALTADARELVAAALLQFLGVADDAEAAAALRDAEEARAAGEGEPRAARAWGAGRAAAAPLPLPFDDGVVAAAASDTHWAALTADGAVYVCAAPAAAAAAGAAAGGGGGAPEKKGKKGGGKKKEEPPAAAAAPDEAAGAGAGDAPPEGVPVLARAADGHRLRSLACGPGVTAGVTAAGTVLVWPLAGSARRDGGASEVALPDGHAAVAVACGGAGFFAAVSEQGGVFAWGSNGKSGALLGLGPKAGDAAEPQRVTGGGLEEQKAVAVAAGHEHTLVLVEGGGVYAWGEAAPLGEKKPRAAPAEVPGLGEGGAKAVAAGARHSVALAADGRVLTWGAAAGGVLGTGSEKPCAEPQAVEDLADEVITRVAAGRAHTLALSEGGALFGWGEERLGALGPAEEEEEEEDEDGEDASPEPSELPRAVECGGAAPALLVAGGSLSLALA